MPSHEYESSLGVTIRYGSTPDDVEITHVMAGSINVFWFLSDEERDNLHKELEERLEKEKLNTVSNRHW